MSNEIEQIRITIEEKKEMIGLGDAILRLSKNRDWKKLIDIEFFEKEPQRLVALLAHPSMQDEASQKELRNQMLAVAYFRQYLHRIGIFAQQASQSIGEDQLTEAELLAEDLVE